MTTPAVDAILDAASALNQSLKTMTDLRAQWQGYVKSAQDFQTLAQTTKPLLDAAVVQVKADAKTLNTAIVASGG